jgi:predicted O-methyltransferase YrrM
LASLKKYYMFFSRPGIENNGPSLMSQIEFENPVLAEMLATGKTISASGEAVAVHSNIPVEAANALYRLVCQEKPRQILEVGMAFGVSTLSILTAIRDCAYDGRLLSIDPGQKDGWHDCGTMAVERAGLQRFHRLIQKPDYIALPQLLADGNQFGLAYLDGWHTFDYTLLDFWYADRMLPAEGIVGFNDCGWPAVDKVIRFVLTHRRYAEIEVGLGQEFLECHWRNEIRRHLKRRTKSQFYRMGQDRYLRKQNDWEPRWDFYADF